MCEKMGCPHAFITFNIIILRLYLTLLLIIEQSGGSFFMDR